MEECEVGEETEFIGKVSSDVAMVEVNAGNDDERFVGRKRRTEDIGVAADVGSLPVAGEVLGVGEYGLLPCLEGDVGVSLVIIGEDKRWRDYMATITHSQELAAADPCSLSRCEAMGGECSSRDGEGEEKNGDEKQYGSLHLIGEDEMKRERERF